MSKHQCETWQMLPHPQGGSYCGACGAWDGATGDASTITPIIRASDLLGLAEVCQRTALSRQRINNLRHMSRFPEPLVTLTCGPIWDTHTIDAWLAVERPSGRRLT